MSISRYLLIVACVLFNTTAQSQYVNPNAKVLNSYASVTDFPNCSPCLGNCNSIKVDNTAGFKVTDRVLLIQMKGAEISWEDNEKFGEISNYGSSGFHELQKIKSISGTTIEFIDPIKGNYDVKGIVQIIRIVEIKGDYTVPADGITGAYWNGRKGGVVFIEVDGTLILNGDIDVRGRGFRGAQNSNTNINLTYCGTSLQENGATSWTNGLFTIDKKNMQFSGRKGEGVAEYRNPQHELGMGPLASGGGGGNNHNAGGGGGSNMGAGGNGGHEYSYDTRNCGHDLRGRGGKVLDRMGGLRLFMGGGGGAGHENNNVGTSGGNGGGIIIIKAARIEGNGHKIIADGTRGPQYIVDKITGLITDSSSYQGGNDGCGGGGAGGAIKLECDDFGTGNLIIQARGSDGGDMGNLRHGPGGGGGGGLVCFTTVFENSKGISIVSEAGKPGLTSERLADGSYSSWGAESGGDGLTAFECSSASVAPPKNLSVYLGPDMHLCNPPSALLDTKETELRYTYNWYRNGVKIPGATTPTYVAGEAGKYVIELLSPNCPPAYDTVLLTKQGDETPIDAVFCNDIAAQKVKLGVGSPNPLAKYGWYDAPKGGNLLFVGTSYQTDALNASATYYVEDTVSVQTVIRTNILPALDNVYYIGDATNNNTDITLREYTASFVVDLPLTLKSVQVFGNKDNCPPKTTIVLYENGVASSQEASAKIVCNAFSSINLNFDLVPGVNYSLRIADLSAGQYKMIMNAPAGEVIPDVITVKPNYNTSSPFFNWNISYGSPCGRMPVSATLFCEPCKKPKPLQLTFSDTKDYLCEGETATITTNDQYDGTNYEFVWYNKADTAGNSFLIETGKIASSYSLDVAKAGTYTVLVRDKSKWNDQSCWTTSSITIGGHELPTYTISGTQTVCEYDTTAPLTLSFTGESPWDFEVSELGKFSFSDSIYKKNLPVAGKYEMLTLRDKYCEAKILPLQSATVTINPRPGIPVVDKPSQAIYKGQKVPKFTVTGTSLLWKNEDYTKTLATGKSYTQTVTDVGRYVYNIIDHLNGCTDTATATLEISNCPSPVPIPDSRIYCYGETSAPEIFATPNGSGTLYWFDQLTFSKEVSIASGNKYVSSKTAPGIYSYYVSEFDPLEVCFGPYQEVKLTIVKAPSVSLSISPLLCSDASKAPITVVPLGGTLSSSDATGALSGTGTVGNPYLFDPYFAGFETKAYTLSYKAVTIVDVSTGKTCDTTVVAKTKVQATPKLSDFTPVTVLTTADVPEFSAIGENIKWYYGSAVTQNQTYYPFALKGIVGNYIFNATQTIDGCESEPVGALLSVVECDAKLPQVVNTNRCFGFDDSPELIVSSSGAVTWFSDASTNTVFKLSEGTTYKPTDIKVGIHNYYAAEYDAVHACWGPIANALFEVFDVPAVSVTGPESLCYDAGKTEISTVPGSVGTFVQSGGLTGNYFYPDAFGTKSESHRLIYEYKHNITGCVNRDTLDIFVYFTAKPSVTDGGGLTEDIASADPLKANGTAIKWYDGALSVIAPAAGLTEFKPSQTLPGNYPHYATQTISGCESEKALTTYSLNDCPAPRPNVENMSICNYESLPEFTATKGDWKVPQPGDAEFRWYDKQTSVMSTGSTFTPDVVYKGTEGVHQFAVSEYDLFNGCEGPEKTFTLTITKQKAPVISVVDDKLCIYDGSAQLMASTYEGIVTWFSDAGLLSPAGTGASIVPSFTDVGVYTYYATDQVKCISAPASVSFTVYDRASIPAVTSAENCAGSPVASMSASGTSITWYNDSKQNLGATGLTYASTKRNVGEYRYYATQTSSEGCESDFAPVTYSVNALPATLSGTDKQLCQHWSMQSLSVNATEPIVLWIDNLGNSYSGASINPSSLTVPGVYSFTVTQTDNENCTSLPATVKMTVHPRPAAPSAPDLSACEGNPAGTLRADGEPKSLFRWFAANDTATAVISTTNSIVASQTEHGVYPYYVSQINPQGCISPIKQVQYRLNKTPEPPLVDSLWSCANDDIIPFIAFHSADRVNWYLGTGNLLPVETNSDIYLPGEAYLFPGKTAIFSAVSFAGNCPSKPRIAGYTLRPQPQSPFINKALICKGEDNPVLMVFGETDSVQWADPFGNVLESFSQVYVPKDTAIGSYYYYISQTINGCSSVEDKLVFQIAPRPEVKVSGDSLGCYPSRRNLYSVVEPNPDYHYEWSSTGQLDLYNPITNDDRAVQVDYNEMLLDTIMLRAENQYGCSAFDSIMVRVASNPDPDFSSVVYNGIHTIEFRNNTVQSPLIDIGISIDVPVHFLWDFGLGADTLIAQQYFSLVKRDTVFYHDNILKSKYPFGDFTVKLIAINEHGCKDSISKQVHMEITTGFFMPTAFCPIYGSSMIREFRPFGHNLESLEISVYDSWGNLLWFTNKLTPDNQPAEGWSGTDRNGNPMPADVYVWRAKVKFLNGQDWEGIPMKNGKHTLFGNVTLIR